MPTIMEVQARLTGNASGMVKAFQEGEKAADSATKSMKDKAESASKALDKMALPAAAISAGATLILKDLGNLASEAEQNAGAVESVFKGQADQIKKFSKSASQDLGISSSEYQKFSGVVGSQLKNLGMPMDQVGSGTNDLIKKGADLASMFGGTTSEAVTALSSLLRGERDPIERYGVSMKEADIQAKMAAMGLEGLSGEAEKQAKLQATLAILNDQTADATGNFARESDTAAGAQQRATAALEDAKATMGEALLPVMTAMAQRLQWFSGILVEHKAIIVPLIGIVAAVAAGIVGLAGAMHVVTAAMQGASMIATALKFAFMATPIGWIVIGLAALVAGFMYLWTNVEGFRNFWIGVWDGFSAIVGDGVAGAMGFFSEIGDAVKWLWDIFVKNDFKGINLFGTEIMEDNGLVAWLFDLRENVVSVMGGIGEAFSAAWHWIVSVTAPIIDQLKVAVGNVFAAIPGVIKGFLDFMGGTFLPILGAVFGGAWGIIQSFVGFLSSSVFPALGTIFQGIGAVVVWLWTNVIVPAFGAIVAIIGGFVGFFMAIWPGISTALELVGQIVVWLWTGVVVPAFQGIMAVVGFMVNWFMSFVWPQLSSIFESLGKIFMNLWNGVFSPVIGFLGAAFFWLLQNVVAPVFNGIMSVVATVAGWFMTYVWPTILQVVTFIGNIFFWLMTNVIGPVFSFILGTISGLLSWLAGTGVPMWQTIFNVIGTVVKWLWEFVIRPVFEFIGGFITTTIDLIVAVFNGLVWFFTGPVATVFRWLWEFVIMPVFTAIWNTVSTVITIITAIIQGILDFIFGPVATVFRWLWESLIKPVFEGIWNTIRTVIEFVTNIFVGLIGFISGRLTTAFTNLSNFFSSIWEGIKTIFNGAINWIRDVVLQPFIDFFNGIPGIFESVRNLIGTVWDGIKAKFADPIRFVVNTVLNDGIIAGYNKLNDIVSLPDIPKITLGFADGGFTGNKGKYEPAGVVHGGEYVIKKEATDHLRRTKGMGFLDGLNKGQVSASGKQAAGPNTLIFGGQRSFGNKLQADIFRERKLNVAGSAAGYNVPDAARMWQGLAAVRVGQGIGGPTVNVGIGPQIKMMGGESSGYYTGNTISLNGKSHPGNSEQNARYKKTTLVHEIGHALGLGHPHEPGGNNADSIMNYRTTWNHTRPTSADAAMLRAIYPGAIMEAMAGGGAPNGGGGDGGRLGDGVRDLMQGLKDKINKAFPQKNIMKDFGIGILDKVGGAMASMLDSVGDIGGNVVDNVKDAFGQGVNRWRDTAKKALEHTNTFSEDNLNSLMRRMKQESGGNPKAVNNWDSNAAAGMPSKGLMQTIQPTFDAYRDKSLKNDIFDPMANIVASINYTKARYGDLRKGWDRKGGYADGGLVPTLYDNGGLLPPGLTLTNNASGRPERVLTGSQEDALMNGGGFHGTIIVQIGDEQIEAKLVRIAQEESGKALGEVVGAAGRRRGIST